MDNGKPKERRNGRVRRETDKVLIEWREQVTTAITLLETRVSVVEDRSMGLEAKQDKLLKSIEENTRLTRQIADQTSGWRITQKISRSTMALLSRIRRCFVRRVDSATDKGKWVLTRLVIPVAAIVSFYHAIREGKILEWVKDWILGLLG